GLVFAEVLFEAPSFHELHRVVPDSLVLAEEIDANDVHVSKAGDGPDLLAKPIRPDGSGDHLERDDLIAEAMAGAKDLPLTPRAEVVEEDIVAQPHRTFAPGPC